MLVSCDSQRMCTSTPNSYAKTQDAYRPVSGGHLNKSIKAYPSMKKNFDQVFQCVLSCSLYLAFKAAAGHLCRPIVFIAGEKEGDPNMRVTRVDRVTTICSVGRFNHKHVRRRRRPPHTHTRPFYFLPPTAAMFSLFFQFIELQLIYHHSCCKSTGRCDT